MAPAWRGNGTTWISPISSGQRLNRKPEPSMKATTIAVSAAVAVICAAILVLLTDIELSVTRWWSCGPLATSAEVRSRICADRP